MAVRKTRLLILTDNHYVSAFLFHGFGLPPWYDLPLVQKKSGFRNKMTGKVNRIIGLAAKAGFSDFDVHEAFPIDLKLLSERALLLRGVDRFLVERRYRGAVLLREVFPELRVQPRLRLIKEMILNGSSIDETDIIVTYFYRQGIPVLYSELSPRDCLGKMTAPFSGNLIKRENVSLFPAELIIRFDKSVPLAAAAYYPGVIKVRGDCLCGSARDETQLLELYRYAGLLVQASRKY